MTGPCDPPRGHGPSTKQGASIATLGYSRDDRAVLGVARYYFQSFTDPAGQGWLGAVSVSLRHFGDDHGPKLAVAILGVVQAMRRTRWSTFHFNAAECPRCSVFATAHEQQLMAAIRAVLRGRMSAAESHAHLLCEGNDTRAVLRAMETLAADLAVQAADGPLARFDVAGPHAWHD